MKDLRTTKQGQVRFNEFSMLCLRGMLFLIIMIGFLLQCSFGLSEADELTVSKVTRITHPAYRAQNVWYGVRDPWNRDHTRVMIFEARVSHPDYPGVIGKGLAWGYVSNLKSWNTLAEYQVARNPLPPVNDNSGWRPDSAYWSPIAGEENIIYGIYTPTKSVRKLNVDTGTAVDIISYDPGDGTSVSQARSFGFTTDNKFIVNFNNEDWSSGGYEINVQTASVSTRYTKLPWVCETNWTRWPDTSHGHSGKNPSKTYFMDYYNKPNTASYCSNGQIVSVTETNPAQCLSHISWKASDEWMIADDNSDLSHCGYGSQPELVNFSLWQIKFNGTTFTHVGPLLTMVSPRGWNDDGSNACPTAQKQLKKCTSNYASHILVTLRKDGLQAYITSTDGKYSYEDYSYKGRTPWGYEGAFLVDFADVSQHTSNTTITLSSPNGAEILPAGTEFDIIWDGPLNAETFDLFYSTDSGTTWQPIVSAVVGKSYSWQVPTVNRNKRNCLIKVVGYDALNRKIGTDISDAIFAIEVTKLTSPNGREVLKTISVANLAESVLYITWKTHATQRPVASVQLKYTVNGGKSWKLIDEVLGNPGRYSWQLPGVKKVRNKSKVAVILKDIDGKTIGKDRSDTFFSIEP